MERARSQTILQNGELPWRWLGPLLSASSPGEVVTAIDAFLREVAGVRRACVVWELDPADAGDGLVRSLDPADLALADQALVARTPQWDRLHRRLTIALPQSTAVVLLELDGGIAFERVLEMVEGPLHAADQRLHGALRLAELARSVARLEHSEQVQRALFAISDLAGSDRDMPDLLRGIHGIVGTLMYAENFYIVLHEAARDELRLLYFADVVDDPPFDVLPMSALEHTLTWYVLRDGHPLRGDAEQLRGQVSGPLRLVGTDSYDWLGVPMRREGAVQGALVVQSYRPGIAYNAEDQTLLEFVASHILTALDRKRSTEDLERDVQLRTLELAEANRGLQLEIIERQRAERLQAALFQIAQLATEDIDEDEFYRRIHDVVGRLLNARNFFIALLSEDRRFLEFPYYIDTHRTRQRSGRPIAHGLSEYVLRHGRALLAGTAGIETLVHDGEIEIAGQGPTAVCWLGVPLVFGDEALGLVAVQSYDPDVVYGQADQELLGFVASQIANSLNRRRTAQIQQQAYALLEERVEARTHELRKEIDERERVQDQLQHEVMHDALTGLPNRSRLRDCIERALARMRNDPGRRCALLYLDVDRFKIINDSLGHLAGDEVLKEVARRLQSCVREPDLVARLSGDEFAILLENVDVPGTAVKVAQRLLDVLAAPLVIAGKTLEPSASIGIAVGNEHYVQADELLRDADTALYRAKAEGRKRHQLFDESLQRSAIDVLAMEAELREALHEDHFEPHFQPIVRLADESVVGHEALLRWNHPARGVLAPADFLKVAEDSGLIEEIDWRMFSLSCARAARLPGDHYLTINVSPRHFRREDFDTRLVDTVHHSGLPPNRLLIEVTEGSLLDDPERVRAILGRLQIAGIEAALDDFGTGYSSLSYLHTFPLRMLKVDRAFVSELGKPGKDNSASVIAAVLALARALGMGVVAEGIETRAQREALLALGCEFGQGHLFGRPAPIGYWMEVAATSEMV